MPLAPQAAGAPHRPGGPRSRRELLGRLEAAVVHREGALVAISKPPGLAVTGTPGQLSLVSLLPDLSQRLGLPAELHVVKAAGKELSGLVLLSGCPDTTQQLHTFFTQLRRAGRPPATYRAVTAGVPAAMEGEIHTGLKLEHSGDLQLVVPVAAPSRRSVERKEVRKTVTRYEVLATAPGCALVQLQPMTAFPSQLLVHLTLLLCPALGDHVYSARVGTVLGESFLLPVGSAVPHTQALGERLLRRLGLTQQLVHRLPLHLHLHQLLLPTTVVTAPPPPFFLRTLALLGLAGGHDALPLAASPGGAPPAVTLPLAASPGGAPLTATPAGPLHGGKEQESPQAGTRRGSWGAAGRGAGPAAGRGSVKEEGP